MTITRASGLVFLVVAISLESLGCGWLKARPVGSQDVNLKTWNETRVRKQPGPRVVEAVVSADGKRVTAMVSHAIGCSSTDLRLKEIQTIDRFSPAWGVAGTLLGASAVGLGLGGYFTATAFGRPDLNDPYSRGVLSKEGSLGAGLPLLGVGLAAGGMALYAILSAKDQPRESKVTEEAGAEGPPENCAVEAEPGVPVTLRTWDGKGMPGTTDVDGQVAFGLDQVQAVLPPPGRPWALLEAENSGGWPFSPPASVFEHAVTAADSLDQYEKFKERFSDSEVWKKLEPRYRQLLAQEEAGQKKKQEDAGAAAEQARQVERDQWAKTAKAALLEAHKLGRKGDWIEASDLLSAVGTFEDDPLNEEVQAAARTALKNGVLRILALKSTVDGCKHEKDPCGMLIEGLKQAKERISTRGGAELLTQRVQAGLDKLEAQREQARILLEMERHFQEAEAMGFSIEEGYVNVTTKGTTLAVTVVRYESEFGVALKRGNFYPFESAIIEQAVMTAGTLVSILDQHLPGDDPESEAETPHAEPGEGSSYLPILKGIKNVEVSAALLLPQFGVDNYARRFEKPSKRLRSGVMLVSLERFVQNDWGNLLQMIQGLTFRPKEARAVVVRYVESWKTW